MTVEILGKAIYDLSKASAKIADMLLKEQARHNKLRGLCDDLLEQEPGTQPWVDAMNAIEAEISTGGGA